jgi:hypothetical protein
MKRDSKLEGIILRAINEYASYDEARAGHAAWRAEIEGYKNPKHNITIDDLKRQANPPLDREQSGLHDVFRQHGLHPTEAHKSPSTDVHSFHYKWDDGGFDPDLKWGSGASKTKGNTGREHDSALKSHLRSLGFQDDKYGDVKDGPRTITTMWHPNGDTVKIGRDREVGSHEVVHNDRDGTQY